MDNENYSLTWHVVPANKLKFEAVIGSGILKQASISFTKEGIKFNKYESQAQLMQISAGNLQEELDLRHVENRQIKKELEKLIQDYKPEKTASTDVKITIILKDKEPVCQPSCRLAFTERQEYEKEMERLKNLLDEVESSKQDIDQASENETDEEIYSSHDSESEFEENDGKEEESELAERIFVSKNNTVWQKEKPNQKVKTSSQNVISHLSGVKGIAPHFSNETVWGEPVTPSDLQR
ncbi:hypothetical protein HNY73_019414 [Argiope bruennichi]|uniref:Uncharacterized protein n=1 Tax=Argiope bruennichi TaxID=94029 RepID=A0A8T0E786_ARGBR|nr:hypothetical protein HNY73_019414 [Argiope bruennichi]